LVLPYSNNTIAYINTSMLGHYQILFSVKSDRDREYQELAEIKLAMDSMKSWFALDINDLFIYVWSRWKSRMDV
jgi:hypothetical protein